jgi:anti-sigma regulatory factor (Ser/Thr protein kinase)
MFSAAVQDVSHVAEARRKASATAKQHGFDDAATGRVALVATELATNLVKHGSGGEILVGTYEDAAGSGVELIALDRGRGIANVAHALRDGYSTAGTPGQGLGAVVRQSHFVDIASWAGIGTAVLARLASDCPDGTRLPAASHWGAVSVPMLGEEVCGDAWSVSQSNEGASFFVADGLGHGPEAAEAAVEAVRLFHRFGGHRVPTVLEYVHGGLRPTRGAAIALARFDIKANKIAYSGIGNISGVTVNNGDLRRMVSMAGTAGHNARKIQSFDYPFQGGLIILHSDGLSSSWDLDRYTGLARFHPTLIAGILYRDLSRRRDDATVLVGKW